MLLLLCFSLMCEFLASTNQKAGWQLALEQRLAAWFTRNGSSMKALQTDGRTTERTSSLWPPRRTLKPSAPPPPSWLPSNRLRSFRSEHISTWLHCRDPAVSEIVRQLPTDPFIPGADGANTQNGQLAAPVVRWRTKTRSSLSVTLSRKTADSKMAIKRTT